MIEDYLRRLRKYLHHLPASEAQEIVAELRSHLAERAATEGEAAAVAALGDPRTLARAYVAERIAARVEDERRPWTIVAAAWRLTGLGVYAAWTFVIAAAGCIIGLFLLLLAALKPFMPGRIGLWRLPDPTGDISLSLGRAPVAPGEDILGLWLVPAGILLGAGILILTLLYVRARIRRLGRANAGLLEGQAGR
jgi:hypothetical protein